jgi:glycosyltransferase involved in cell wall biosynthesis
LVDARVSEDVIIVGNPNDMTRRIFERIRARRIVFYLIVEGDVGPNADWLKNQTVIAPSRYVGSKLEARGIHVAGVIPHTVSTFFPPRRRNLKRLLYVANYTPGSYGRRKYPAYGIKALSLLHAKVTAITSSDNPFVEGLNVVPTIHRLGDFQLSKIYQQYDFYINLSDSEGFGLTVLEAMAHGLVVITPEYAPITEFTNRSFALYVPVSGLWHEAYDGYGSGDIEHRYYSPESMASAIGRGLSLDNSVYSQMSERASNEARKFPPSIYLKFLEFIGNR